MLCAEAERLGSTSVKRVNGMHTNLKHRVLRAVLAASLAGACLSPLAAIAPHASAEPKPVQSCVWNEAKKKMVCFVIPGVDRLVKQNRS